MNGIGIAVASLLLLWCALLYVPFRWRPLGMFLFMEKTLALGYTPFIVGIGVALVVVGALLRSWWMAVPAGLAAVGALVVIVRVGSVRVDLSGALDTGWEERIPAARRPRMVRRWWSGRLASDPQPRLRQDVPFATPAGTDRALLCDVWQPPLGVRPSGLAMVYLHGSSWYVLDKDFGTRPLFRHLAAQGHVIVDVAYRLFPETDVPGMVTDARRAVAWVREHARELEVDPQRIVLAGGSAGAHLALLAAHSDEVPALSPSDLAGSDLHVAGVAALYAPASVDALYWHCGQDKSCHQGDRQPDWTAPPSRTLVRLFGRNAARLRLQFMAYGGRTDWLVGGTPDEVPEAYALVSAFSYVRADCPPTLLLHGTHDEMAPVAATRTLQHRMEEAGAPVAAVYLPHTDHAFDLIVTRWSPAARVAVHTLERFLAAISTTTEKHIPAHAGPHSKGELS